MALHLCVDYIYFSSLIFNETIFYFLYFYPAKGTKRLGPQFFRKLTKTNYKNLYCTVFVFIYAVYCNSFVKLLYEVHCNTVTSKGISLTKKECFRFIALVYI